METKNRIFKDNMLKHRHHILGGRTRPEQPTLHDTSNRVEVNKHTKPLKVVEVDANLVSGCRVVPAKLTGPRTTDDPVNGEAMRPCGQSSELHQTIYEPDSSIR